MKLKTNTGYLLKMRDKKTDYRKVIKETEKNLEFDKKHPPLISTKAFIDEGIFDAKDLEVTYDKTTRLFTNKDRTIAFQNYNDATRHNNSLGTKTTVSPPKPFNNMDKSTYPSTQYKNIQHWDLLVENSMKNPKDPNSRDTKRLLMREYNNPKSRKNLTDLELRAIGKHKSQIKPIESKPIPKLPPDYKPYKPEPSPTFDEFVASRKKVNYGLNEKLVADRIAVKEMTDWVLGKKAERDESKNNNNEENDD